VGTEPLCRYGRAQPDAVERHAGVPVRLAEVRKPPGLARADGVHHLCEFGRKGIEALRIGADLGDVNRLSHLRLADIVTACTVLLIERSSRVCQRGIDAVGGIRRRLQIQNPVGDPIERREVHGLRRRPGADRRALVPLVDRIVVAVPVQP
jgi:hypothetical protein